MRYILLILVLALAALAQNPVERVVTCIDAGSSDAYACTPAPAVSSYTTGLRVRLKANTVNTGAATVNVSSLGAQAIKVTRNGVMTDPRDAEIQAGQYVELIYDGTNFQMLSASGAPVVRSIGITIDGGGSAITTGVKGDVRVPFACTITEAALVLDQSGSIVIDVWKDTTANYPPTDADSITASAPPTVTAATNSVDTTLTGWTTAVAAGDTIRFNVDSATTATRATLILKCIQ